MSVGTVSSTAWILRPWGARVLVLAVVGGFCGLALEATAASRVMIRADFERTPARAIAPAAPTPLDKPEQERLVWTGVDVDGDGQADFANPTGGQVRACDDYGCGSFGAERDAGERRHEGVDFDAVAGQAVQAPISGFVSKIGDAYSDDDGLKFVEITNPALHYVARAFYVDPSVSEGQAVRLGQPIGEAHSLQVRYPGITNHVHLEIARQGRSRIDSTRLIVARLEPVPRPAALARTAAPRPARG